MNVSEYLVWAPLLFSTCTLRQLCHFLCSRTVSQTFWRTLKALLWTFLPFSLFSVKMIPHFLNKVGFWALGRPVHNRWFSTVCFGLIMLLLHWQCVWDHCCCQSEGTFFNSNNFDQISSAARTNITAVPPSWTLTTVLFFFYNKLSADSCLGITLLACLTVLSLAFFIMKQIMWGFGFFKDC